MPTIKELEQKALQECPECGHKLNKVKVPLADKTHYYFLYCPNLKCRYARSEDEEGKELAT
jgi:ssDNA-binding Zn-finger/Zn-ribbon topoisomerase 1